MVVEAKTEAGRTFILDTSFLKAYSDLQLWTIEPVIALRQPNSIIDIPAGIEGEFNRRFNPDGTLPLGSHSGIYKLLGVNSGTSYRAALDETLTEKLREMRPRHYEHYDPLTGTDMRVVQAAVDYTQKGIPVAVASADAGIRRAVDEFRDQANADIEIFSPERKPSRQESIDLLVSGDTYEELPKIQADSLSTPYLAVALDQHVGGGVHYNIILGVYTHRVTRSLPKVDGVDFIRLYALSSGSDGKFTASSRTYIELIGHSIFGAYDPEHPTSLFVFKSDKPLPLLERHVLLRRYGKRGYLTKKERQIIAGNRLKENELARIELEDIKRHDKLTVGRINEMRYKLNGRNGHH